MSAESTILTEDEQREIFRLEGFRLGKEIAVSWSNSCAQHAPVALCSAIDAIAQCIAAHVCHERVADFLAELSCALRKSEEPKSVAGGGTPQGTTQQTSTGKRRR